MSWFDWLRLPFAVVMELVPSPFNLILCIFLAPLLAVGGLIIGGLLTLLSSMKH